MSKICEQCRYYNQESKTCSNYYNNKSSVKLPEKQNLCCYFEDKDFDYTEKDNKKLSMVMAVIVIIVILSMIIF